MIENRLGDSGGTLSNFNFQLYQAYLQILKLAEGGARISEVNLDTIREKFDNLGKEGRASFYLYLLTEGHKELAYFFKQRYENGTSLDESHESKIFTPKKMEELEHCILGLCNPDSKSVTPFELEVYKEQLVRLDWREMKELYKGLVKEGKTAARYLLNNFIRKKFLVQPEERASIENVF